MRGVKVVDGAVAVVDVPEPEGDGALVHVRSASICGSDLAYVQMGVPVVLGHEFAGVLDDGTPVAVESVYGCGACDQCAASVYNRCRTLTSIGLFVDGGLADRVRVPESCLLPLPDRLPVEDACLVETTSVSTRGLRRAAIQPGERVAVVGGGSIGLVAAGVAAHWGVDVDLEARHDHQVEAGERLGAGRPSGEYDVVVDAAGSASALARAIELLRPGGRLVLLGVYHDTIPLPGVAALMKEATIINSMAATREDFAEAADVLAANPDIAATVLTDRFPLVDAPAAFARAAERGQGVVKVAMAP